MEKPVIEPIVPLTPRGVAILVLLLVLGFIGNFCGLPLFFGVDFILGSIAVFIVLYFYGLGWGVLAALVASSYTYVLWGHPYAVIIFSLEALCVGLFWGNGRRSLVLLDTLFWLVIGMPLVWLCYGVVQHLDGLSTQLIMLKQSVNGVFNALLASLAINYLPWGKFLAPGSARRTTSLQETLLNLLVAAILAPALVIMIFNSRQGVKENQTDTIYHMELVAADIAAQLSLWHQQNLRAVTQLADLASKKSLEPSPALQHDTEVIDKAIACFRSMVVANAQGTTIAFSPAVNAQGQSNIGINFADRRYFQAMQTTRRPVLSEVFLGRVLHFPVATLSVPIFQGEHFRGFALGALDLQRVQKMLQPFGQQAHLNITLVDSQGHVIVSTGSDRKPLMPWKPQDGAVQPIRASVYQWLPGDQSQPAMARWKDSCYVGEYGIPGLPWKLVVEAPLAPLQERLYLIYVRNLAIMAGLTLIGLLLAMLFSRWLVRPLAGLAQVTSNLPDKLVANQDVVWPESSATEMHSLVANFKTMARSLTAYVQGLKAANIDLTMEIAERTRVAAALRDSEARYRLLADNARDVIFRLDQNQQLTYLSPSVQLLTGFSPEEAMNLGSAGMLTPTSLQMALDTINRLQEVERQQKPTLPPSATLELEIFRQDGGTIWIEIQAAYLRDSQGHFAGFMGVARDLTERRRAEAALLTERNKFKQVLETMPNGVYIVSAGYDIEYLNPVLEREFGPVAGRKCYQYFHDLLEPCSWCRNAEVFAGKSVRWEWQSTKTGKIFDLFDTPLVNADGSISKFEIFHDISELKIAEAALRESEQRVRLKLDSILSPAGDLGNLDLADIIDVPAIQALMNQFHELTHFPASFIDLKGKVLVGVGWQEICTKFHRMHPQTCQSCLESDTELAQGVPPGEFRLYKCKNHMWDIATPIMVGGHHLGNLFSGQFFFENEPLDYELFRAQAREYGFDEPEYLAALDRVPRLSRATVDAGMAFLVKLANMLSLLSYSNIKLARALTERAKLTDSLREHQERLHLALAAAQMGVWEWNVQNDAVFWSPECHEIFGLESFGGTLADFITLVHPEDVDRVLAGARRALTSKEVQADEYRIIRPNGEMRWVANLGRTEYDENNEPQRMVGAVMDITERKLAEEALAAEAIRRRILIEQSRDGIVVLKENGKVYEANQRFAEMLGYSAEEVRNLYVWDWDAQWHREDLEEQLRAVDATGAHLETRHRRRDGTIFEVDISTNGAILAGQKLIFCVCRDISQRKAAEEGLRNQVQFTNTLLETIPSPVFYKDTAGRYLGCNRAFEAWLGIPREEIIGKNVYDMGPREIARKYEEMDRELFAHPGSQIYEWQIKTGEGSTREVIFHKATFPDATNKVGGLIGVITDVTVLKEAEKQLRALAARMAEAGEEERQNLARELHDQVCQNLAMLGLTLESLKIRAQQEPLEELLSRLGQAADLVEQTGEITRELMEGLRPTVLDHYGLLEGLRRWTQQFSQRTGISVEVQGQEAANRLAAPVELALFRIAQEALSNVAKHARATWVVLTEEIDQDAVRLVIADNGVGFDPQQVMETEGRQRWGLMTMSERAIAAGGRCRFESQPGQGTRVIVEVNR